MWNTKKQGGFLILGFKNALLYFSVFWVISTAAVHFCISIHKNNIHFEQSLLLYDSVTTIVYEGEGGFRQFQNASTILCRSLVLHSAL